MLFTIVFKTKIPFVEKMEFHDGLMKDHVATAVTMCGWLLSSKEANKNSKDGRYNVKGVEFPGVQNANMCGCVITSDALPILSNYRTPENSHFRYSMCLCDEHKYLYHESFIKWFLSPYARQSSFAISL